VDFRTWTLAGLHEGEGACYNRAMVIDFHTHVFSPRLKENRDRYVAKDPGLAVLYSSPKAKIATADELIESMDRDGVDISVILNGGWTNHELCIETNDYIMESAARYPKRLVGFCTVSLKSVKSAVAEIERCVRGGTRGVGEIRLDTQAFDPKELLPVIEVIREHNLILLTHASEPVGHQYAGKGKITPDLLYALIAAYPDIIHVCAHWGGGLPFYALMPEVREAMRNVYFDSAASPFLYVPEVYRRVSDLVGADRILFGTDYPLLRQGRLLREVNSLNLPPETREQILSGNARRLLGITGD
jgi:predicted TIM-barrel fold metal-dependent hydrolase